MNSFGRAKLKFNIVRNHGIKDFCQSLDHNKIKIDNYIMPFKLMNEFYLPMSNGLRKLTQLAYEWTHFVYCIHINEL